MPFDHTWGYEGLLHLLSNRPRNYQDLKNFYRNGEEGE
jgi:hypothetical protein